MVEKAINKLINYHSAQINIDSENSSNQYKKFPIFVTRSKKVQMILGYKCYSMIILKVQVFSGDSADPQI